MTFQNLKVVVIYFQISIFEPLKTTQHVRAFAPASL